MTATVYENESFGLSEDDEYEILLEDIEQAIEEGDRRYGYGYGGYVESEPKVKSRHQTQTQTQKKAFSWNK